MFVSETYGCGSTIDSVYCELNQLQNRYGEYIDQEFLHDDVELLKHAIEECLNGSSEAAEFLNEHGSEMLALIKEKLALAVNEQIRIIEESPNLSESANGQQAHKLSRAAALVEDAKTKLEVILKPKHNA